MTKNLFLVGGHSGVGSATLAHLAKEGHNVHVATRRPELVPEGLSVSLQTFEATQPELNLEGVPDSLDGLVYTPGTICLKPFQRLTHEDFLRDWQVNVMGAAHVLQQLAPALKKSGNASVVLFSTVAVAVGLPFHATVAAAKGALEAMGRSLAAEWAPTIRVNMIALSLTDTPLAAVYLDKEEKRQAAAKRHPLNTVGNPADIASLVAWLLGDSSRFITGQVFRPDGGLSSVRLF